MVYSLTKLMAGISLLVKLNAVSLIVCVKTLGIDHGVELLKVRSGRVANQCGPEDLFRCCTKSGWTTGPNSNARLGPMKCICNAVPNHFPRKRAWIFSSPPAKIEIYSLFQYIIHKISRLMPTVLAITELLT